MRQYTLSPDEIIMTTNEDKIDEPKLICIGFGQAKIFLKQGAKNEILIDTLE